MRCICCCAGCSYASCCLFMCGADNGGLAARAVEVDTGARVPYDYLILASGSTYPCPEIEVARGSLAERKQAYAVRLSPPLPIASPPTFSAVNICRRHHLPLCFLRCFLRACTCHPISVPRQLFAAELARLTTRHSKLCELCGHIMQARCCKLHDGACCSLIA